MTNVIAYDTLQIILEFAGSGTKAMTNRKDYYDLFEKKKGNLLAYMKKWPDNGLARPMLITYHFTAQNYLDAFELCLTKDHLIQLFDLFLAKNDRRISFTFNNREHIRKVIDDNIIGILIHFDEQPETTENQYKFGALMHWFYNMSFKIAGRIIAEDTRIKFVSANKAVLNNEFSISFIEHLFKHHGAIETYFEIIAKKIWIDHINGIDKSSALYRELVPRLLIDKTFSDRNNGYCLERVMNEYQELFNHYHYTSETLVAQIDQIMKSTIPFVAKKNMINDRYPELLLGHYDPRSLLVDMPEDFVNQILFAITPIRIAHETSKKLQETLDDIHEKITALETRVEHIEKTVEHIDDKIIDVDNNIDNVNGNLSDITRSINEVDNDICGIKNMVDRIDDNVIVIKDRN